MIKTENLENVYIDVFKIDSKYKMNKHPRSKLDKCISFTIPVIIKLKYISSLILSILYTLSYMLKIVRN